MLLSLSSLLLAQAAPAQPDWRPAGLSGNRRETHYDAASVVRGTPVSRVRVRFTEENGYVLSMIELRCNSFEGRMVGTTTFDANGVEQSSNGMATPFRAIIANSFMDTLSREICGAAAGPARPQ
jgi:hypothetical protein